MNATKGFVVPAGGGKHLDMTAPGRFAALKLVGHETNESIMLFEETLPVGTKSLFHLHRDSDEVAWVLAGEITFKIGDEVSVGGPGTCAFFPRNVPHAWKSSGSETGRVLFLYTPAAAGGYVEELLNRPGPMNDAQRKAMIGLMEKMTATPQWAEACKMRDWTPIALFGDDYKAFLDGETARIESILKELGLA